MKLKTWWLEEASTSLSIADKGNLSLEQALLRSVKSTHILHLSLAFLKKVLHLLLLCR